MVLISITPSSVILEPGQTQQFIQTGITTPVWTLEGNGTLNETGFYTAPGTAAEVSVRVGDTIWGTLGANVSKNADDTLNVISSGSLYSYLIPVLNNIGDFVEFDYFVGMDIMLTAASPFKRFWWRSDNTFFSEDYPFEANTPSMSPGDVGRLERISSTQVGAKKNGSLVLTFQTTSPGPFTISTYVVGSLSSSPIPKPRVGGSGVSGYNEVQAQVTVSPPLLTSRTGLEIYCQSNTLDLANDEAVTSFTDLSGNARHLQPVSNAPLFKTSGDYIQFDGATSNPLRKVDPFSIKCGFMIAKYDDATFPAGDDGYKGLLTGTLNALILAGQPDNTRWFNTLDTYYEYRDGDHIYPANAAPAPMEVWKLMFFRFWKPLSVFGIQIGQNRIDTNKKWKGGVKFLALYSSDKCEEEIREDTQSLATYYGFTLADVYPYQADKRSSEEPETKVNFYYPPEGDPISEVVGGKKRIFELEFSSRRRPEKNAMKVFHDSHFPQALECIYRNYNTIPPEDIEGYIDSDYSLFGALNNYSYGFRFKEK